MKATEVEAPYSLTSSLIAELSSCVPSSYMSKLAFCDTTLSFLIFQTDLNDQWLQPAAHAAAKQTWDVWWPQMVSPLGRIPNEKISPK